MKVVILAGGFGTRISEESIIKPKPMIEINGTPILIHIMRYFYKQGYKDFIICGGYKCDYIKKFFIDYKFTKSDINIDYTTGNINILDDFTEKWNVSIIDTGLNTQTAGRIARVKKYIEPDESFILTYGDGISDVLMKDVLQVNTKNKSIATITAIEKANKFGNINFNGDIVTDFSEKTNNYSQTFINGGFMVLSSKIFNYISNDGESFEFDILPKIAKNGGLSCYLHKGFWKCMDTLKDKSEFEELFKNGELKWI